MDPESTEDLQQVAEGVAAAAERDPVRYLTYHEARRTYAYDARPEAGGQTVPELESAAAAGDLEAMVALGLHREGEGDISGALDAYRGAAASGYPYAHFRLGFAVEIHERDLEAALRHYLDADEAGDANGAANAGRLLKENGDLRAAEEAFGRSYDRGGVRALSDHAGLMSNRTDATAEEIADVVAKLCAVEDMWVEAEVRERRDGDGERLSVVESQVGPPLAVFSGMWRHCDRDAMEAGVAAADRGGSAAGAYHLGVLLREREDRTAAAEASARAGERGYPAGWTNAAVNLGELGDQAGAEHAARKGDAMGEADATVLLGLILDEKGDRRGSIEANRRADAMGHKDGAFHLGIDLVKEGALEEAEAALQRALERGEPKAEEILRMVRSGRGG